MNDDELGPASRALLDAARQGMSPTPAAIERVRAGIAGAATASSLGALAAKLAIVGLVAAAAVGATVYATRSTAPEITRSERAWRDQAAYVPYVPGPNAAEPNDAPVRAESPDIKSTELPTPPAAPRESASIRTKARPRRGHSGVGAADLGPPGRSDIAHPAASAKPAAPVVGQAPPSAARVELAREVELLDRAMGAMRRLDYSEAIATVRLHATETSGAGQLAEAAAAIEIEAMCHLHYSVYAKLEAFDARWPSSSQRSRLANSCK